MEIEYFLEAMDDNQLLMVCLDKQGNVIKRDNLYKINLDEKQIIMGFPTKLSIYIEQNLNKRKNNVLFPIIKEVKNGKV